MKFKFYTFIFIVSLVGCKENIEKKVGSIDSLIEIYDFDNQEELHKYEKLDLDKTHPNLLNPQISKTDLEKVMESWSDLHQRIGKHLSENNFHWQVDASAINIVHKIYFEPNGKIKNYFFRVLNKAITNSKRKEYAKLIVEFAKTQQIHLKKERQFAQCGKTKYLNK